MAHRAAEPLESSSRSNSSSSSNRMMDGEDAVASPTLLASSAIAPSTRDGTAPSGRMVSQPEEDEDMEQNVNHCNSKRIKLAEKKDDSDDQHSSAVGFPAVTPAATSSAYCRTPTASTRRTPLTCKKEIASLLLLEAGIQHPTDATNGSTISKTTKKRTDYISFDDYFMATAVLSSHRSKDPVNATGACLVDSSNNHIIGTGYNGFPMGCSDDVLPWWGSSSSSNNNISSRISNSTTSSASDPQQRQRIWLHTRSPYTVTAEVNAILNKVTADCTGARLYIQQFPNADSAKLIIQSGISEVVYMAPNNHDDEDSIRASRILLTMAGVRMRRYQPAHQRIVLDFTKALDASDLDRHDCCNNNDKGETKANKDDDDLRTNAKVLEHRELLLREANYDPLTEDSCKRKGALSWDDYFLSMAFLAAQRSKDPNTQVGACIVDANKRIVGLGYNGFPMGCSDDDLPWARHSEHGELHKKYVYVCHAEVNAVMNKGSADVRGATLYVALFPCNECAKVIVQAGIREVVFMSDRYHDTDACRASRIIFRMAGVRTRRHIPSPRSICIQLAPAKENSGNDKESLDSSIGDQ